MQGCKGAYMHISARACRDILYLISFQVLEHLLVMKDKERIPILIISLDDVSADMVSLVEQHAPRVAPTLLLFHPGHLGDRPVQPLLAIKRHWLWLQRQIWTQIPETKGRHGDVILLEEDHLVSPDFLVVMEVLLALKNEGRVCPRCWGVSARYGCAEGMQASDVFAICRSSSVINTGESRCTRLTCVGTSLCTHNSLRAVTS